MPTPPLPTGTQYDLTAGAYRATVTEVGGALRSLTIGGRDLVVGFPADVARPRFRGSVLVPWPNRVGDGRYTWAGSEQQLALTEPDRGNALHGLACWLPATLVDASPTKVALTTRIWPQQGWPGTLDVTTAYALAPEGDPAEGLTWTVSAHNVGGAACPYGVSVHPYLVAAPGGPGRVDDWTLRLGATRYLDVDPERLLPREVTAVEPGSAFDFAAAPRLAGTEVDHAFTGVDDGVVELRADDGRGVGMWWDPDALPWVQVHTGDRPEPDEDRLGLAFEPMTCAPDALRTGDGLITLAPGERHEASWRICALD